MDMSSGTPFMRRALIIECLALCERTTPSVAKVKLPRRRDMVLATVFLLRMSDLASGLSEGNSAPDLGQVHVSRNVILPWEPRNSLLLFETPFCFSWSRIDFISAKRGFRRAGCRFSGLMSTEQLLKSKSLADKANPSDTRKQSRWQMRSKAYSHDRALAMQCFSHSVQSLPGRVAAWPSLRPCFLLRLFLGFPVCFFALHAILEDFAICSSWCLLCAQALRF